MPLIIENILIDLNELQCLSSRYNQIKESCLNLKSKVEKTVDSKFTLYVNQREYAIIKPNENIEIVGSDDATTCHILILRHTGCGFIVIGHLDGYQTFCSIEEMFTNLIRVSSGGPDGNYEAHIVGGFNDDQKYSLKLSTDIFNTLNNFKEDILLKTACILDDNNIVRNGINYPAILGIAIEVKTGIVFSANFKNKVPDIDIRSAGNYGLNNKIYNIYKDNILSIGPYNWKIQIPYFYKNLDDATILKNFSTSPEQEPVHFCQHMRQVFQVLLQHGQPLKTLFPFCQPIKYHLNDVGDWVKFV